MSIDSHIEPLDDSRSILGRLLRLAWPVVLSVFFHTSYNVVDMLWVSRYLGGEAVAAVTLSGIIFWAVFAVSQVFSAGVLALVARAFGAGQREKADHFLGDGLLATSLSGVVVSVLIALFPDRLLSLLGANAEVAKTGIPYVQIMAIGCVGSMALFTLCSAYNGAGDMISPLILTGASCIINIFLDPILILGIGPIPPMGLAGAALATIVSIYMALAWGLSLTVRPGALFRLRLRLVPSRIILKDLLTIGIPSGLHYVLLSLTQTVMIRMVAFFGTVEVAATGIGSRITELSFLPCLGIGAATATMVGQQLGAGLPRKAERTVAIAIACSFVLTSFIGIVFSLWPRWFLSVFNPTEATLALASTYLRISAVAMVFVAVTITLTRAFQGAGDTVWPGVTAGARFFIFAALGWELGWRANLRVRGVWLAMLLSSAAQMLMIIYLYNRGTWKHKRLHSVDVPVIDVA
jgi:putative MATE family efflux protein